MTDYLNKAFVVLFLLLISIPLLTFHHEKDRVSVLENKNAVQWPELSEYSLFDSRLTAAFDEYFSDNIGMKDEMVLSNIFMKYRLFDQIGIPDYIKGKEQHLFYIYDEILQNYQGRNRVSEQEMEDICQKFFVLDTAVQQIGAQLIFMPIPNKEEIYGEYMPDSIRIVSDESALHSIKDYLAAEGFPVVDTERMLLQEKGTASSRGEVLYYRSFDPTHWNAYGAFVGYQALLEVICAIDPDISMVLWDDVVTEQQSAAALEGYSARSKLVQKAFSDMSDIKYTITPQIGWNGIMHNDTPESLSIVGDPQKRYYHYINETVGNGKNYWYSATHMLQIFCYHCFLRAFEKSILLELVHAHHKRLPN